MKVYIPEPVAKIIAFYGNLLETKDTYPSIGNHLEALALRMWEGVREENESVIKEISNYHRQHLGRDTATLLAIGLNEEDCKKAIANEYGFRRWSEVVHQTQPYEMLFEGAIDALLTGRLKELKQRIGDNPWLVNSKSRFGHRATLLHYSVSNGVEMWRQKVPLNLPEAVEFLLEAGINPQAKMNVYEGAYTASELLFSSTHPRDAGIFEAMRKLLVP